MKKNYLNILTKSLFIALLSIGLFSACSNSTSGEEEHSEPEGFVLVLNGQTVVEQLPDQSLTGSFNLSLGEETDLITIEFLDHDGQRFQPDEPEYSLGYEFSSAGVAEFEQHAEDGKWSFHIHALAEGSANLKLMLMHDGHSDFTTQDIQVTVASSAN